MIYDVQPYREPLGYRRDFIVTNGKERKMISVSEANEMERDRNREYKAPTTGLTFGEALDAMKAGKRIRLPHWSHFMLVDRDQLIRADGSSWSTNSHWDGMIQDILRTDWEIVEEKPERPDVPIDMTMAKIWLVGLVERTRLCPHLHTKDEVLNTLLKFGDVTQLEEKPEEVHDILWAIKQLKAGKKVRMTNWLPGGLRLDDEGALINEAGKVWSASPRLDWLDATNWALCNDEPEEPAEAHDLAWAVRQMQVGKKVRSVEWYASDWIKSDEDGKVWDASGHRYELHIDALESKVWEIAK